MLRLTEAHSLPVHTCQVDFPTESLLPTGTDLDDDPLGRLQRNLTALVTLLFDGSSTTLAAALTAE